MNMQTRGVDVGCERYRDNATTNSTLRQYATMCIVEWGPLPKGFPTGVMENIWALDGTHTGAMVLYHGFDEQA